MNTIKSNSKMDIKIKLSTLWIVVMFNMAFADILSFMLEFSTGRMPEVIATQEMMLIAAILIEIGIVMIFLSRALSYKANRWTNIIAAILTILFVIGGGQSDLHYIFIAAIEVSVLLIIVWKVLGWKNTETKFVNN